MEMAIFDNKQPTDRTTFIDNNIDNNIAYKQTFVI